VNDADINFYSLSAKRDGGMPAGGLFLREFVPGGLHPAAMVPRRGIGGLASSRHHGCRYAPWFLVAEGA
jgi:hypothetical protein